MTREDNDDDFVTKTAGKHRKKNAALVAVSADPKSTDTGAEGISLRPRTMFSMKGRGRTETEGSAYRPQWSKDGEGFVSAKESDSRKDGSSEASRRSSKNKVLRYSKEELLALHVPNTEAPTFPPETVVASEHPLPPVSTLPFDYEEIYKQWALNRNRGRGRGRGNANGNTTNNQAAGGESSDRTRSDSKREDAKPAKKEDEQEGENTWRRGARVAAQSNSRDDVWDEVGDFGSDDKNEMDLSSMAEAAERFRREMDAMREQLKEPVVDLEQAKDNLDAFDQKLEEAAAADQFEDSDEEVQWDDPVPGDDSLTFGQEPLVEPSSSNGREIESPMQQQYPVEEKGFALLGLMGSSLPPMAVEVKDEWFYLDPQGSQQGPFKSVEMREWFEAGYFKPHLPIRFGREGTFTPLANQFSQGQVPFAGPPPVNQNIGLADAMRTEQERLLALQHEQHQRQQMLQLQQQQEHQRLQQLDREEKIRMEMQRLEIARQQQTHLFQQQQMLHQQQQRQQQQQHMLLQQQSAWQRSQREGIMSALGIFGGNQDVAAPAPSNNFQQPEMQIQFQSEFRTRHHMEAQDAGLRDQNQGIMGRDSDNMWPQASMQQMPLASEMINQQQPVPERMASSGPSFDAWGGSTAESEESFLLRAIESEDKRRTANEESNVSRDQVQSIISSESSAATSRTESAHTSPAKQATQAPQKSPEKKSKVSSVRSVQKSDSTTKKDSPWVTGAAATKSLKDIQHEEQRALRKQMEEQSSTADLAHMGAQLKMMLGVDSMAGHEGGTSPAPAPGALTPASATASTSTAASAPSPSPWGASASVPQASQTSKQSLRDILAEEERLAQERAKQVTRAAPTSSHWMNVVAGNTVVPAVPKPSTRVLGPVPTSVLKSRQQVRTANGADAAAKKTANASTPSKAESDASFWNFGVAGKSDSSTPNVSVSNAFGSSSVSSELMSWCAKQLKAIGGREDLTLMEYCASLEDPGEIREYLAAYLGSTPRVSAFATEFIQRKKSGSSTKKSPSGKASPMNVQVLSNVEDDAGKKRGKRRSKGQKIDPSLLNYSVGN